MFAIHLEVTLNIETCLIVICLCCRFAAVADQYRCKLGEPQRSPVARGPRRPLRSGLAGALWRSVRHAAARLHPSAVRCLLHRAQSNHPEAAQGVLRGDAHVADADLHRGKVAGHCDGVFLGGDDGEQHGGGPLSRGLHVPPLLGVLLVGRRVRWGERATVSIKQLTWYRKIGHTAIVCIASGRPVLHLPRVTPVLT